MAIKIKGVIGYDIIGTEFADRLSRLDGDVVFEIDSPGGSVFHGISIYNAIKNYKKGKKTIRVVGDASSMAAYIMLAGDDLPIFEPNAVCVLHNPWTLAIGDYKALQKEADILERLAALYAKAFVEKGLFEEKEIRQVMDEETWFIGAEQLKKLGTIAGDTDKEEAEDKTIEIEASRQRMKDAQAKIREINLPEDCSCQIAALIPKEMKAEAPQPKKNQGLENLVSTTKEKGERKMVANLDELKAQKPSIYAEAKEDGVKAEQKRVKALISFIDTDQKAVVEAIKNGTSVNDEEFQAAILQARINGQALDKMKGENPADVNPQEETHAPEGGEGGEPTEEQKKKAQDEAEAKQLEDIVALMGCKE